MGREAPTMTGSRPFILVADDDPAVRQVLARDLRREFGATHTVVPAGSGAEALELTRQARLRDESVALFLVDERMPGMTGVEFLGEARTLYPDAGRILLTAYTDVETAIRGINEVRLDHFILKPWDPPEERLFPVVRDLLEAWGASIHPSGGQVRVVGRPAAPDGHRLRNFLFRNLVPHRWLDADTSPEARELLRLSGQGPAPGPEGLPVVFFPDGAYALRPSLPEVAARVGLRTHPETTYYDLVIVGAGPAGLAAAVYGASEGLTTLVVERHAPGGQAGLSASIENYLGFPSGLSGEDLARRGTAQARRFGSEILTPVEACSLEVEGEYRILHLSDGSRIACRALLVATGVSTAVLEVPGAAGLYGRGVHYGAGILEALSIQGEDVVVVGGGNSAGQAAVYLSRFARSVTILIRGRSLASSMSRYLIARIEASESIRLRTGAQVEELHGNEGLQSVTIRCGTSGEREEISARGLFVFIGTEVRTEWVSGILARDPRGFLLTGPDLSGSGARPPGWSAPRDPFWLETNVPGIFAAGDVRHGSVKRVASAVGEGAMAVQFVHRHLNGSLLAPRTDAHVPSLS
jgi:thioredoxin reductase (NADPH)